MKIRKIISFALMLSLGILCGCDIALSPESSNSGKGSENTARREIFAMDTIMTVSATGERSEDAVEAAVKEIQRLDDLLSVGNSKSEVSTINKKGGGRLSEDVLALTKASEELYEMTDGAYDITVYPLMELWGFTEDSPSLPDDEDIEAVKAVCGSDKMKLDGDKLTLGKGQGIDFGGIAKGYTSSRIMDIFSKYEVTSGIVSLGGNVQCYGQKPDGSLWRCGITDPDNPDDMDSMLGILSVSDKAVITSGGYERYFIENGTTYHHIMDPSTGYPAESGLTSVTIVSSDGTLADGLSTSCFIMGMDLAADLWRHQRSRFDMILAADDGIIYVTEGIAGDFTSDREVNVLK